MINHANATTCEWDKLGKHNKACAESPTHEGGLRKYRLCARHAFAAQRDLKWRVKPLAPAVGR